MAKIISILGSTGSIGRQALEVLEHQSDRVGALSAGKNWNLLEQQARRFRPQIVVLEDPVAAGFLRRALMDTDIRVLAGVEGLCIAAALPVDCVLDAVVGFAGLRPALAALSHGNPLALANKECLVAGGTFLMRLAKEKNLPLLPVDSEHSAIFQCLKAGKKSEVRRVILTASGGAFFGKKRQELLAVTARDALCHPTWEMGDKITVDSATLMNKGHELIEAAWLFDLPLEKIDILVHPQSIVHSLVEFVDGAVIAQLGTADMRLPIQYALTYPERNVTLGSPLALETTRDLQFFPLDEATFPAVEVCRAAFRKGGFASAALCRANEQANERFRRGEISFLEITEQACQASNAAPAGDAASVEELLSFLEQ